MNLKTRINRLEKQKELNFNLWLRNLSDEELEALTESYGGPIYSQWLAMLTDEELEILCYGKPGAKQLQNRFYEYQKQNEAA